MYTIILSQAKFIHKDALQFPLEERGLQFGDGVYEVIRIYHGKPYLLDEHVARLFRSLQAIQMRLNLTPGQIKQKLNQLIDVNDMQEDGFIYLQITRGTAERNHPFPENAVPNFYAYIKQRERPIDLIENGVKTILLPDERWDNCYIKSLNLLPNVLAKQKAAEQDAYEAILHRDGRVTEASSSNVFLVKDGTIYTHPEAKHILNGCVRTAIIRFTKQNDIPLIEQSFTKNDINEADELFLTSSLSEVMPIVQIDDQNVANGQPGPIAKKLQEAYESDAQISEQLVTD